MKKVLFSMLAIATLAFTSCTKEGPAGPAGPAGDDGSFTTYTFTSAAADWAASTYVEYPVAIITQEVMDKGIAMVYVQDEYGYWNPCPSSWHPIAGYTYVYTAASGGVVGLDVSTAPTMDYQVRVVTMNEKTASSIPNIETLRYDQLMSELTSK
ncbi:MAG: hypothetical protein NWQ44_05035 [Flavobacteriales bacterium]|jgi:hypothetical protein|nr:hypothetical protein [Flavobacteriales bacterium]MDP4731420.1 hypothetical protein [Flavobacteriales bacterium]MDP4818151.1 hypothetical protein [Flavobacteriales bacterium]MDP4951077.1 hypothetical protein [Flavobacteriales bacterium]